MIIEVRCNFDEDHGLFCCLLSLDLQYFSNPVVVFFPDSVSSNDVDNKWVSGSNTGIRSRGWGSCSLSSPSLERGSA